jgi:hypothetical protein
MSAEEQGLCFEISCTQYAINKTDEQRIKRQTEKKVNYD